MLDVILVLEQSLVDLKEIHHHTRAGLRDCKDMCGDIKALLRNMLSRLHGNQDPQGMDVIQEKEDFFMQEDDVSSNIIKDVLDDHKEVEEVTRGLPAHGSKINGNENFNEDDDDIFQQEKEMSTIKFEFPREHDDKSKVELNKSIGLENDFFENNVKMDDLPSTLTEPQAATKSKERSFKDLVQENLVHLPSSLASVGGSTPSISTTLDLLGERMINFEKRIVFIDFDLATIHLADYYVLQALSLSLETQFTIFPRSALLLPSGYEKLMFSEMEFPDSELQHWIELVIKILKKVIIIIWNWYYKDVNKERKMDHPGKWRVEWKIAWIGIRLWSACEPEYRDGLKFEIRSMSLKYETRSGKEFGSELQTWKNFSKSVLAMNIASF